MLLPSESILTDTEVNGLVWKKIKVYIDSRIEEKRTSNDQTGLSEVKTSVIRGEIKALKDLKKAIEPEKLKTSKV